MKTRKWPVTEKDLESNIAEAIAPLTPKDREGFFRMYQACKDNGASPFVAFCIATNQSNQSLLADQLLKTQKVLNEALGRLDKEGAQVVHSVNTEKMN